MFLGDVESNDLGSLDNGWFEMEIMVDSGACDTVMPVALAEHIQIHESAASRRGKSYEAANGTRIENVGERRCLVAAEGGNDEKLMHFQVADVKKALLSVTKTADMGFECVLGARGGFLQDVESGERIPIQREGNSYIMRMWVKDSKKSFHWQD